MLRVEFTVEPFVEGTLGPHVTAAVDAVAAHGIAVEVGPFGNTFTVPPEAVGQAVADLLTAAYSHGATHVQIHVEAESAQVGS